MGCCHHNGLLNIEDQRALQMVLCPQDMMQAAWGCSC